MMDFEKGDMVYKHQPVLITAFPGEISGKIIGADFEENTILVEIKVPAKIVKSLEQGEEP